jgi:hypothetical protein
MKAGLHYVGNDRDIMELERIDKQVARLMMRKKAIVERILKSTT